MKNIESKINKICETNQVTQNNQGKSEWQLRDLVKSKSINFNDEKFDELERINRKKEEEIDEMEAKNITDNWFK